MTPISPCHQRTSPLEVKKLADNNQRISVYDDTEPGMKVVGLSVTDCRWLSCRAQ